MAAVVRSFQLTVLQDESSTPRPGILLEVDDAHRVDDVWRDELALRIRDRVATLSRDYRTSLAEFPEAMLPIVRTFAIGSGPFEGDASRIKQRRVAP